MPRPGVPPEGVVGPGILAVAIGVTSTGSGPLLPVVLGSVSTVNIVLAVPGVSGMLTTMSVKAIGSDETESLTTAGW